MVAQGLQKVVVPPHHIKGLVVLVEVVTQKLQEWKIPVAVAAVDTLMELQVEKVPNKVVLVLS